MVLRNPRALISLVKAMRNTEGINIKYLVKMHMGTYGYLLKYSTSIYTYVQVGCKVSALAIK